ncbi:uncharacterized protein PODANS_2_7765 [Podospora anserina S mat+]|uniref:Podospora anserina S mat+ genomic DNA chromosome 2, supercontig 2 n=1 Tax=Podospora anserina (strain S / ATCC MYA-4624 / DSM 980 / FGSC 10383) TaxID=515849 RepID=B2B6H0_PODAN|nr:uncharacterized protein PODANS_2_7765 [Podospora anserina S mat+]CAP73396.1 unnamed protein product [Podospora anserina S mat+]CDP25798.1 Putative protein of unknown function [Podospora anserina S mat+]
MLIKRLFVKEQQDFRPMSSPRFSSGSCPRWQQRDAPASRAPNQYLYPWFPPAFGPSPPFQTIKHTLTICTMISILTIAASALAFSSVAYSAPAELAPSNGTATVSNYTVYYECNPSNLKWAEIKNIQIGRDYLNGLPGKAKIAGGKHCDRVSCSYNSAIFYCNDDDNEKEVEWERLAEFTSLLLDKCGDKSVVKGRVFDRPNWHTEVQGEAC